MEPGYEFSELAEEDLFQISLYVLENFGDQVADRVIERIKDACEVLTINPNLGHEREDITPPPVRFWRVGPSYIVYRPDVEPLQIARIVRVERDLLKLFEDD